MRLLVALDGTDASDDAFEYALDIAGRLGATLLLAYAVEPAKHVLADGDAASPDGDGGSDPDHGSDFVRGAVEEARTAGDRRLNDAARRAEAVGVDADTRIVDGEPLDVLPELADEASADGIVVGHRPADPDEVVDSVARGLIERAAVPVTVVP
jgi:nucleotide-binding universal stress UspA family protein